jgi:RNA-dependent RNA polymerase
MDLNIRLPSNADYWTVTRKIAGVLHDDDFLPNASVDPMNFRLRFKESTVSETRNSGGTLTIPNATTATKFLRWVKDHPIKIGRDKLRFFASSARPGSNLIETLRKTFYTDPDIEEEHEEILRELEDRFRVEAVQIGLFHRTSYPDKGALGPRDFSIEWEKICTGSGPSGWLTFKYQHKYFQITVESLSLKFVTNRSTLTENSRCKASPKHTERLFVLNSPASKKWLLDTTRTLVRDRH